MFIKRYFIYSFIIIMMIAQNLFSMEMETTTVVGEGSRKRLSFDKNGAEVEEFKIKYVQTKTKVNVKEMPFLLDQHLQEKSDELFNELNQIPEEEQMRLLESEEYKRLVEVSNKSSRAKMICDKIREKVSPSIVEPSNSKKNKLAFTKYLTIAKNYSEKRNSRQ